MEELSFKDLAAHSFAHAKMIELLYSLSWVHLTPAEATRAAAIVKVQLKDSISLAELAFADKLSQEVISEMVGRSYQHMEKVIDSVVSTLSTD